MKHNKQFLQRLSNYTAGTVTTKDEKDALHSIYKNPERIYSFPHENSLFESSPRYYIMYKEQSYNPKLAKVTDTMTLSQLVLNQDSAYPQTINIRNVQTLLVKVNSADRTIKVYKEGETGIFNNKIKFNNTRELLNEIRQSMTPSQQPATINSSQLNSANNEISTVRDLNNDSDNDLSATPPRVN